MTGETRQLDVLAIRRACRRALGEAALPGHDEMTALAHEVEEYVRLLVREVERLAPRMNESMREQSSVVLRLAGEVLGEDAPRADVPARLHDLGVVTRALVALYERPGELAPAAAPVPSGG